MTFAASVFPNEDMVSSCFLSKVPLAPSTAKQSVSMLKRFLVLGSLHWKGQMWYIGDKKQRQETNYDDQEIKNAEPFL